VAVPVTAEAALGLGDTYVFRVIDNYSKETRGDVRFQVTKADAEAVTVAATPSGSNAGAVRTQSYTRQGNWLRHPIQSHGQSVEYVFATPYPAYAPPLEKDKKWSTRVKATASGVERNPNRSVRVDGRVLRNERIRTLAGEFDTIVIHRIIYVGDAESPLTETQIAELEWFAPALGMPVRIERNSGWQDMSSCGRGRGCGVKGDWLTFELAELKSAKP